MTSIVERVAALIRETRKQKGLTQKELGDRLGGRTVNDTIYLERVKM